MFCPVVIFMAISLAIGLYTYTKVRGSSKNYTVCNKAMPFIVIGTALMAQAVDGNATLGNVSMTWSTGFWTGAMIPLGLAASLFFVGRFLAAPLNKMDLLTLPEFFYRRYDRQTEALTSALTVVCCTLVIAGNLSAVAWIFSVVSGLSYGMSLAITTILIVVYTMAGGLFAAIWTDFFRFTWHSLVSSGRPRLSSGSLGSANCWRRCRWRSWTFGALRRPSMGRW